MMSIILIENWNLYMNKVEKKYFFICILSCILTIITLISSFGIFIMHQKKYDVFDETCKSVLELKCVSQINETFGSAVCYSKGFLITNAHCVTYDYLSQKMEYDEIYVRCCNAEKYTRVNVYSYDIGRDIAILKYEKNELSCLPITMSENKPNFNDEVYAIGNALNHGISLTKGVVSIPSIYIKYDNNEKNVIQCDLVINEGNSGGALINKNGELIGITTFRLKDSSGSIIYGVCFCVPIEIVIEYYESCTEPISDN